MVRYLELEKIAEPVVTSLGCEFVGLEMAAMGKNPVVRLYIDKPGGVNISDCEKVTRQVSAVFDVESDFERGEYTLEVSSPGLDRKLFNIDHFKKFIGKKVRVMLQEPIDSRRNLVGIIKFASDDEIKLMVENEELTINFANVAQANIIDETARQ